MIYILHFHWILGSGTVLPPPPPCKHCKMIEMDVVAQKSPPHPPLSPIFLPLWPGFFSSKRRNPHSVAAAETGSAAAAEGVPAEDEGPGRNTGCNPSWNSTTIPPHCQHCRKTTAFLSRIPPPANDVGQQRAGGGTNKTFCSAIAVAARSR
jgi:hypothetical protein